MIELNPHGKVARIVAFVCYVLAGFVLLAGVFFTLAAATADVLPPMLSGASNLQMALLLAGMFLIIAVMIVLFGWRIQKLFGQRLLPDKLPAKSLVGGLRLSSLGCGLWALLSASMTLITGKQFPTGEKAGFIYIFAGMSGATIFIIITLAVARFISKNYTILTWEDRKRAFEAYCEDINPRLLRLTEPDTRAYVQERTIEVLTKLDASLKSALLRFLSDSNLLTGYARVALNSTDFRQIDLRSISLPRADLHEINLEQSTLQGAFLFEANLRKADLKNADLSYANLEGANLRQADLTEALLWKANLRGADLTEANVTSRQLEQAHLEGTVLPDGAVKDSSPRQ